MLEIIIHWLQGLPKELVVITVGALPVSELRGAIPLALYWQMPVLKAYFLAVAGNLIPVIPGLFLLEPVSRRLRRFRLWAKFFDWLFERTRKKADSVEKYEALGLLIFVAIPLPMTGAWSGIVAASLFKIKFRYAFFAIVAGVLAAGMIVLSLYSLGVLSWKAAIN